MSIDERRSLTVITITAVCWAVQVIISAKTLWQAPAHSSCYLFSTMRSPGGSEGTCTEIINLRALNHSHFHPSAQVVQMKPAGYCAVFSSPRPNAAWERSVWVLDLAYDDCKSSRRCSWKACSLRGPNYCECAHFLITSWMLWFGKKSIYRQETYTAVLVKLQNKKFSLWFRINVLYFLF